ncbi:MAG: hypothetical protein N4Q30_02365 [Neisseriaceae bacterium]|nr:hypothetical protein [Neisseriaceae bacterium]
MSRNYPPLKIGFLLFPDLTQLDLTAPYKVFSHVPNIQIELIAKELNSITSDCRLWFVIFAYCYF